MNYPKKLFLNNQGVTGIEYALIAGLLSIVVIVGFKVTGISLGELFDVIKDKINEANGGSTTT